MSMQLNHHKNPKDRVWRARQEVNRTWLSRTVLGALWSPHTACISSTLSLVINWCFPETLWGLEQIKPKGWAGRPKFTASRSEAQGNPSNWSTVTQLSVGYWEVWHDRCVAQDRPGIQPAAESAAPGVRWESLLTSTVWSTWRECRGGNWGWSCSWDSFPIGKLHFGGCCSFTIKIWS